jgi:hypothetical protein
MARCKRKTYTHTKRATQGPQALSVTDNYHKYQMLDINIAISYKCVKRSKSNGSPNANWQITSPPKPITPLVMLFVSKGDLSSNLLYFDITE